MEIQDTGPTLTITIGEKMLKFGKLSPNDRRSLLKPLRESRRKSLKENLKEGGITGPEYVNEMDAFDQAFWGEREFFGFAESYDGQAEILALGLKRAGEDPAALDTAMELDSVREIVAKVAGIKILPPDPAYVARQRYKFDLREAGIQGELMIEKLAAYDDAHGTEGQETHERPSAAVS